MRSLPALRAPRGPMRHPVPLLSQRRQKVPTDLWAESSLPAAHTVDHSKTAGEEFRLLFAFIPSLPTGDGSGRVTLGRGKNFAQVSHVAGSFPAVYPYSTATKRPNAPIVPHLMIGRQANFVPACTFAIRTGSSHSSRSSRLGRKGTLVSVRQRCAYHTFARVNFAAFAIHATKMRLY